MAFIQLGWVSRVDEMILARVSSGFAGKKYGRTSKLGFVFEERPNEAIDVSIKDEKSPSSELQANARYDARGSGSVRGQDVIPAIRECTFTSECAEGKKVKFDTATLQGPALTWWNVKKKFNEWSTNWNLKVKKYNIVAYTQRFNELALMCKRMVEPERVKVDAYIQGLTDNIKGKENGVNILKSIDEGPFQMGIFWETLAEGTEGALGPERPRVYSDLSPEDKDRYNADIRATNILLQGLPKDIYSLINHYTNAKDIWDNVKMLGGGDKWGRFVTVVKLNRGLRDSNYDQLYAYLKQHEAHANENKMLLDRFNQHTVNPLALMSNVAPQQYNSQSSTNPSSTYVPPHFADNSQLNLGLSPTDNLIENLTNTLALLTQSYKTYLPQTNNQLKTSSNPRNQATVQDGRVVVQNVQGRQNRGQGNNARGASTAGYGGAQNRVGNANPGGHDNAVDEDVDEQPVKDLALNVDNVFQSDDCDAFDYDVDEAPTTQDVSYERIL
ncbi:hypothetical protein Tco_1183147 [Tanacetum coccineum]